MLDIQSISGILAALGVMIGVVFTVVELRNLVLNKTDTSLLDYVQLSVAENFWRQLKES